MAAIPQATSRNAVLAVLALCVAAAVALWLMGRVPVCSCGYVKLWEGEVQSAGNSQHLSDWYSPSHIIHGFVFYWFLWLVARHWTFGARLVAATAIEIAWEVIENTPFIINRYRETTVSLDYFGDSILNSMSDTGMMILGFWLASRLPVWLTIALAVGMEIAAGIMIRDNLSLNVIMLLWPVDSIRQWQMGQAA